MARNLRSKGLVEHPSDVRILGAISQVQVVLLDNGDNPPILNNSWSTLMPRTRGAMQSMVEAV